VTSSGAHYSNHFVIYADSYDELHLRKKTMETTIIGTKKGLNILKINKLEIIKNLGAPLVTYFSV
jgi:hypothetical protein